MAERQSTSRAPRGASTESAAGRAGRNPRVPSFLNAAPSPLIRHYGRITNGRERLERLLTLPQMNDVWVTLSPYVARRGWKPSDGYYGDPYIQLWSEICHLLLNARKKKKTQAELDDDLEKIEEYAKKLRHAIVDPDRTNVHWSRDAAAKTGARFDYVPLYEYFPAEVMKINMQAIPLPDDAWAAAQGDGPGRAHIAGCLLPIWPTLSEVLDELLARIQRERDAERATTPVVQRRRKNKSGDDLTPQRFFVIGVVSHLEQRLGVERKKSAAIAAAIATATLGEDIPTDFVSKAMRRKQ